MQIVIFSLFPHLRLTSNGVLFSNSFIILVGSILTHIYYKKSLPSEIVFYIVFLCSLSIQSLRIIPQLLEFDTFMIRIIIGKVCLFFKYVGLLSLLGASLFTFTIKKQKIGTWMLSSIASSFVLSSIIHFNTGFTQNNLLPGIIFGNEELVITITILIISTGSFLKSAFDAKNKEFFYMAAAAMVLSVSMLLTFITLNLLTGIIMGILLATGSALFLKSMHNITLWG